MTYEQAFPPSHSIEALRGPTYFLVTPRVPITDSAGQTEHVFVNVCCDIGQIDTAKYRVVLSSSPKVDDDIIVDDGLFVNGNLYGGWSDLQKDPVVGHWPEEYYVGIPAVDITSDLRADGRVFIQLADLGGGVYCCSPIYVVILPREG